MKAYQADSVIWPACGMAAATSLQRQAGQVRGRGLCRQDTDTFGRQDDNPILAQIAAGMERLAIQGPGDVHAIRTRPRLFLPVDAVRTGGINAPGRVVVDDQLVAAGQAAPDVDDEPAICHLEARRNIWIGGTAGSRV